MHKLKKMFEEDTAEKAEREAQDTNEITDSLSLTSKNSDSYVITDPDFDAFIVLLRGQKTKDYLYVAALLTSNHNKIFVEYSKDDRVTFQKPFVTSVKKLLLTTEQTR